MRGYSLIDTGSVLIYRPRSPRPGKRLVALLHGAGSDRHAWSNGVTGDGGAVGQSSIPAQLARDGITCFAADVGGQFTWGIDSVVQSGGAIDAAATAAAAALPYSVATDKLGLVGVSMGSVNALRYMATQPAKVAFGVVILPLVSMGDFYGNNKGGFQASVAGAWGVTAPAALPTRADPSGTANVTAIASSGPLRGYYSTADTLMTPALEPNFAAAVLAAGGDCTFTVCDTVHGHSDISSGLTEQAFGADWIRLAVAKGC